MSIKLHSVLVSPLIKKLYPGFKEYEVGMEASLLVCFKGETSAAHDSEFSDLLCVPNTATANRALSRLAELYKEDSDVPKLQEIEKYDIWTERSVPASTVILRLS